MSQSDVEELTAFARTYREAFTSFDPAVYGPMLVDDPVYHAGMTMRRGHDAYHQNTGSGKVLYPFGALRTTERRLVVEAPWVAALIEREAITNKGAHYENTYTMFYEVLDSRIATQVEILDFRVSGDKFDLSELGPELRTPGVQAVPTQRAELPSEDDSSATASAKRTVLAFLDAFLSFEPDAFDSMLCADPLHQVGVNRRTGKDAFREIARIGRILYPQGIADRTHHLLVSDGRTVATLVSMRAVTNRGVDYENLYGMFFDVHDGQIVTMIEGLDNRVAAEAFDLSALA
ncbi:MAG: nuclear transport factor 2 family protein [Acidimicrobiales bacterium]|nr:nuclear transport factor 2 family protein [Acidimicrobiales bacterium]